MLATAVLEYATAVRLRGGGENKRILDECCETTAMRRKGQSGSSIPGRRPRRYGAEVAEALVKVWEVGDRMSGPLLAAVMGLLVESLERHGELKLTPPCGRRSWRSARPASTTGC
jgi:hypothetical protein